MTKLLKTAGGIARQISNPVFAKVRSGALAFAAFCMAMAMFLLTFVQRVAFLIVFLLMSMAVMAADPVTDPATVVTTATTVWTAVSALMVTILGFFVIYRLVRRIK